MEEVIAEKRTGHYGDVGRQGANALYKNYKNWVLKNKPGKQPMNFKEWMAWAEDKGIVSKRMRADGNDLPESGSGKDTKEVVYAISRTGKIIAWSIIVVTTASLCYYLFKPVASVNSGGMAPAPMN